ncbi:MAG: UDP-N-acetylglucosamine 1-carboxyvinyltransferase [Elusimicrobia bacterium]|nr:UDP-N-acetylglucosamine 1-carboxyvinyltransferase [Elusimicrobiota bacterium]
MDQFIIDGGRPLRGSVAISGSKNAALPILIATLLTDESCVVENVPVKLRDIKTTIRLLESLGKRVEVSGQTVRTWTHGSLKTQAPYELVKQMRASVLAAGPLLARFGLVRVPIPGGCAIGLRPIDIHLRGFDDLGARRIADHGDVILSAPALKPGPLKLKFPSVGATENLMMAAAALPGATTIENAAREPEIADLARFLERMGAQVRGAGSSRVSIRGSLKLSGCRHRVIPDRIEAGTFMLAAAASQGHVRLEGAEPAHLQAVIRCMRQAGAKLDPCRGGIEVSMSGRPRPVSIKTAPYPGFPTDLQAPWMAWMCLAQGKARIREEVFENRFLHAAELARMGARIGVGGHDAVTEGVEALNGAPIMASDIRAGAALLVAALAASGRTVLQRVYHIDRGYEKVEQKLRRLGASLRRVNR